MTGDSQHPVGPHHVPDISEVPSGLQVPHPDHLLAGPLVGHDPGGQGRAHEAVALPATQVVERPSSDHVLAMSQVSLQGHEVGCGLRRRVGRHWSHRRLLGDRQVSGGHRPVYVGAGHCHHPVNPGSPRGGQHVHGALHIGPKRFHRVVPGTPHIGLAGQVEDHLGPHG